MNRVRSPWRVSRFGATGVFAALLLVAQLPTELPSTKFSSGQDVQPYFEGWIRNADGTFDLVFGYFNRNWQEELAIPAGPRQLGRARRRRSRPADVFSAAAAGMGLSRSRAARFRQAGPDLDDHRQRQDPEGVRRAAAGGRDHRAHHHDARQPQSRATTIPTSRRRSRSRRSRAPAVERAGRRSRQR